MNISSRAFAGTLLRQLKRKKGLCNRMDLRAAIDRIVQSRQHPADLLTTNFHLAEYNKVRKMDIEGAREWMTGVILRCMLLAAMLGSSWTPELKVISILRAGLGKLQAKNVQAMLVRAGLAKGVPTLVGPGGESERS